MNTARPKQTKPNHIVRLSHERTIIFHNQIKCEWFMRLVRYFMIYLYSVHVYFAWKPRLVLIWPKSQVPHNNWTCMYATHVRKVKVNRYDTDFPCCLSHNIYWSREKERTKSPWGKLIFVRHQVEMHAHLGKKLKSMKRNDGNLFYPIRYYKQGMGWAQTSEREKRIEKIWLQIRSITVAYTQSPCKQTRQQQQPSSSSSE